MSTSAQQPPSSLATLLLAATIVASLGASPAARAQFQPITPAVCLILQSLGVDIDCDNGLGTGLPAPVLGREVAIAEPLVDGQEFELPLERILEHGGALFGAVWTVQEGGGRPLLTGTGQPLSDPESLSGDAATACTDYRSAGGEVAAWNGRLDDDADLLVDALLGS
ncbi:MAG: hypothetical protein R3323_08405, partial [Wenzhouxiangellaceae bacterium]|nr:hypothetical protein [Wenzhouxiangellaceae bacterium]